MNIVFLSLSPDASMYGSLVDEFLSRGHEVTVVAPVYEGKSRMGRLKSGAKILYFRSLPMLNVPIIRKGIANVLFPYCCIRAMQKHLVGEQFDLILASTPTITIYRAVKYLKSCSKDAMFYLILRDIHPEGARFIGLDKIWPLWAYFRNMERKLYRLADRIGCMSPGNIEFIRVRNRDLKPQKLTLLPNWEQCADYTEPDPTIREKYGLTGKFVLLYGGNMGIPQNLDILLQLAECKKDYDDVVFLLIGRGTERSRLEQEAKFKGLNNVYFRDFIPRSDFDQLMKSCNVGFISLHPAVPIPNIPSKTLGYFAAKLPVLAAVDPITDYGSYILDAPRAGLWSLATDIEALSCNFDTLYNDPALRKEMGGNGYRRLQEEFSVANAYQNIMREITVGRGN